MWGFGCVDGEEERGDRWRWWNWRNMVGKMGERVGDEAKVRVRCYYSESGVGLEVWESA